MNAGGGTAQPAVTKSWVTTRGDVTKLNVSPDELEAAVFNFPDAATANLRKVEFPRYQSGPDGRTARLAMADYLERCRERGERYINRFSYPTFSE